MTHLSVWITMAKKVLTNMISTKRLKGHSVHDQLPSALKSILAPLADCVGFSAHKLFFH